MESLDPHTAACLFDNFLNFDDDGDDDQIPQTSAAYDNNHHHHHRTPLSLLRCRDDLISELVEEEELEWISNKDTFPMVESLVDFMPSIATGNYNGLNNNHRSPISVLENSSGGFDGNLSHGMNSNNSRNMMMISLCNFKVPGKARTKHRSRRRDMTLAPQFQCWSVHQKAIKRSKSSSIIGRKCLHCGSEKTPQWRAGPLGPKTLCNACGVRYKSGRLCDEYRPASSPTFSPDIHSNSHRKVMEMRRQKMVNNGSGLKPAKID